jgi:hypothetical protein
VQPKHNF